MRMMAVVTRKNDLSNRAIAFKMLGVGWYIAFCLGAGLGGGWLLDNYLDTFPVFALVMLTLGLFVAFYGIYRMILPLIKEAKNQEEAARKEEKD